MKIAVVTPFYQTPQSWLEQCLESVCSQTLPCTHFLISDGDELQRIPSGNNCQVIQLPQPHANNGNTPRAIGSICAISQGFDAIAYLDSDNWYQPNHLESLVALHQKTGAAICTSRRTLHHVDGMLLGLCLTDDGETFVDTSCLFLTRDAFGLVSVWYLMEQNYASGCDRVFWENIKAWKLSRSHTSLPTVAFRTRYRSDYSFFGVEPPEDAKDNILWPPAGSPGIPIWSPLLLKNYNPPQSLAQLSNKQIIESLIFPVELTEINLIFLPDWFQQEEQIIGELYELVKALFDRPDKANITLLIDGSTIDGDEANLLLCNGVMNLFLQEDLEVDEMPKITLLGQLTERQWEALFTWSKDCNPQDFGNNLPSHLNLKLLKFAM